VRMSRLFGETLREAPAGIESPGHQFLLRAGYVRQLGQGSSRTFHSLAVDDAHRADPPRGADGHRGVEVSLPVVHPRSSGSKAAGIRRLVPSSRVSRTGATGHGARDDHEEVVASLAAGEISSYRQLPRLVFQIQIKWRDDPVRGLGYPRPRVHDEGLLQSRSRRAASILIPGSLRRLFRSSPDAACQSSPSGRRRHHGWQRSTRIHVPDAARRGHARAVRQLRIRAEPAVATSRKIFADPEELREVRRVETPHATTIEELAELLDVAKPDGKDRVSRSGGPQRRRRAGRGLIVAVVRGDTDLNEAKLANLLGGRATSHDTRRDRLARRRCRFASPIG